MFMTKPPELVEEKVYTIKYVRGTYLRKKESWYSLQELTFSSPVHAEQYLNNITQIFKSIVESIRTITIDGIDAYLIYSSSLNTTHYGIFLIKDNQILYCSGKDGRGLRRVLKWFIRSY